MDRDDGLHAPKIDLSDLNLDIYDYSPSTAISGGMFSMTGAQPTLSLGSGMDTITISDLDWSSRSPMTVHQSGTIDLRGEDADIMINGVSLCDTLEKLQQRLNVLTVDPELEAEWDQLRALGDEYRRLEAELQEKSQAWKALKKL
jgi:uncharacterized small protein (DUF1192 family)